MKIRNMFKKIIRKLFPKRQISHTEVHYNLKVTDIATFEGKKILVTGATGAIGSATVYQLFLMGATVGVGGRNTNKVEALIKKLEEETRAFSQRGRLVPIIIDVSDEQSIVAGIKEFADYGEIKGLYALVNNAGGSARRENANFFEQSTAVIDSVLSVNLRGSMLCAREAAKYFIQQKVGKIINMSSVVGMNGKKNMCDYAAAKAGIIGFTKSLAVELGEYNIKVNCISPGQVFQIPFDLGIPIQATNKNWLKRFGYTDEVASLITFILSEKCDYITGHNFVIDGGRSIGLCGDI